VAHGYAASVAFILFLITGIATIVQMKLQGDRPMKRGSIVIHSLLIAGSVMTLFPLLWMLSASFMTNGEATTYPPHLIPHAARWSNTASSSSTSTSAGPSSVVPSWPPSSPSARWSSTPWPATPSPSCVSEDGSGSSAGC